MTPLLPISTGDPAFDLLGAGEALAEAGVTALLLREPHREPGPLWRLAESLRRRLPELVIHARCPDGVAMARALAAGLHLPGDAARPDFNGRLGRSIHNEAELIQVTDMDYALLSPVWTPSSKPGDKRPPLGPQTFASIARGSSKVLYALGGVTPARARLLRGLGAQHIAVQGWLFSDNNLDALAARARELLAALAPPVTIV